VLRPRSDSAALERSGEARDKELCAALFCARARCAWSLKQRGLAHTLLSRASDATARLADGASAAAAAAAAERMSAVFFDCGRSLLSADDAGAVQLLQSAYEHAAAAHAAASGSAATCRLYYKTLQCLAVAHLKGNAHELALNAARTLAAEAAALPAGAASAAAAASVAGRAAQFLCINALCGLGRLDEACEHLAAIAADADVCASSAELLSESATCLMRAGRADAGAAAITALLTAAPEGGVAAALRFVELALADAATWPAALTLLTAPAAAAALKGDAGSSGADGDVAARKRLAHLQAILWNSATTLFESKECAFRSRMPVRAFSSSASDECA
jgi:hypothetical protein